MAKAKVEEAVMEAPETPTEEQVELSKKELEQRRKEITDYYSENIKHLKVQLEYETLLKDIEKTRAERVQAQMFLAQATAPPTEQGDAPEMSREEFEAMAQQGKRTLRRES